MKAQTLICGAGIAGIATAYYLAVKRGRKNIILVDKLLPMSLTTSQSGENYRDYWPQPCMSGLSSHSIDLMEELGEQHDKPFNMRDFGYQFVSQKDGQRIFGAIDSTESGIQTCNETSIIRQQHGYLSASVKQLVTITRAGTLDVYALGSLMLREARTAGVTLLQAEVTELHTNADQQFQVDFHPASSHEPVICEQLVLCAGPFNAKLAKLLAIDLALVSIPQRKFVIPDPLGIIPSDMPFTICADPITLDWTEEESQLLSAEPSYRWLLHELPAGLHIKPESKGHIKLGWAFNREAEDPLWQIPNDNEFPDIVLRGASCFIPGLRAYVDAMPTPVVQTAGYYTRTEENLPLVGPLEIPGLFTIAGLSGFGTMTACAVGELCAQHMTRGKLPAYARHFHPARSSDDKIMQEIRSFASDGQL